MLVPHATADRRALAGRPAFARAAAGVEDLGHLGERAVLQIQVVDLADEFRLRRVDHELAPARGLGCEVVPRIGLPPNHLPLRLDAAILSRVRSEMISRSNWANESRMFSVSRPIDCVVLNCCVTDTNDTRCFSKTAIMRAKSRSDRDRRSTFTTTTQSTFRPRCPP